MLSYRHSYHAANHADMLKHMTLCLLLDLMRKKQKDYVIIDTHSASGIYSLTDAMAQKNAEYETGLSKILNNEELQALVPSFYEALASLNSNNTIKLYPGSAYLESYLSTPQDKLFFIDLHQSEHQNLLKNFKKDRRIKIMHDDGFDALKSLLPPTPRRALIFIDPSYELKNDYDLLLKNLKQALQKFATGMYVIWFPVLGRLKDHSKYLISQVKRLNVPTLLAQLNVCAQEEEFGMCGSGMLILNYPFGLESKLEQLTKILAKNLAIDNEACAKFKVLVEKP